MKKFAFLALISTGLTACAYPEQPTVERQQLKEACVTGDYLSCADLGHKVHYDNMKAAAEAAEAATVD